jgi:hypothetical protein
MKMSFLNKREVGSMTPSSLPLLQRDRNLSLVVRDDSDHCNCFALLSQGVAKQLHSDACSVSRQHGQPEAVKDIDRLVWSVSIPDDNNLQTPKIEFLPLAVTFSGEDCEPITIFASYNGGDFNSILGTSNEENYGKIVLCPCYAGVACKEKWPMIDSV